jgi:hypothetical protein
MPVLGTMVASLTAGGCVTTSAMQVGAAREMLTGFPEVRLSGTILLVRYKTMTWYGPSRIIEESPDRWTTVTLDSLSWLELDRLEKFPPYRMLPLECSVMRFTPEPAPALTLHPFTYPFKDWYSPDAPEYQGPVAAFVDPVSPRELVLVRATSGDGGRAVTALNSPYTCVFDRPWAPYARVALVPFAVLADIVTSPFQGIYFLMIALGH